MHIAVLLQYLEYPGKHQHCVTTHSALHLRELPEASFKAKTKFTIP